MRRHTQDFSENAILAFARSLLMVAFATFTHKFAFHLCHRDEGHEGEEYKGHKEGNEDGGPAQVPLAQRSAKELTLTKAMKVMQVMKAKTVKKAMKAVAPAPASQL